MRKQKGILIVGVSICILLFVAAFLLLQPKDGSDSEGKNPVHENVDGVFENNTQEPDGAKYANLNFKDFKVVTDGIDGVYNIEIISNNSYKERSFLENFKLMRNVIDNFFKEEFDKSSIVADFYPPNEDAIYVNYYDIEKICQDEKYNTPSNTYLFGNNTSNGGYMVQIDEAMINVWFSKNGFGNIMPSQLEYRKVYRYLSGVRQGEDVEVNLKDGTIKLSELEENLLGFLNEDFSMDVSENISFGIGDARILNHGDCDGICFKVRRFYKGIPFEYGSNFAMGMYIDKLGNDKAEVSYLVSDSPDSMLSFGRVNGTVVETEKITQMISMDKALQLLSEEIGENSIYDVYGIELVYRECAIPDERVEQVDAILKPCWKVITVNQNDEKYTLFYVDVVTGEITDRFEYFYN